VTRALGVVAAVIAAAWFALGVVQSTSEEAAGRRLATVDHPSPAAVERTRRLLDRASWLNPDQSPEIQRAHLQLQLAGPAASVRALLAVARHEPRNVKAWVAIALVAAGHDPGVHALALGRIRELDPRSALVR
jgi:hypothetical protein